MHHPLVYKKNKLLNNGVLKNTHKNKTIIWSLYGVFTTIFFSHILICHGLIPKPIKSIFHLKKFPLICHIFLQLDWRNFTLLHSSSSIMSYICFLTAGSERLVSVEGKTELKQCAETCLMISCSRTLWTSVTLSTQPGS